ncbi:MAG: hypothetical protein ACTSQ0_00155 [Candidatus Heimdallarchaeota archaeon]
MFNFRNKKTKKFLLIGMSILNVFMLISLIFFLLLSSGYLEDIFYLVAFPIDYLSNNYLVLTFFLLIEILVVIYGWFYNRNKLNSTSCIDSNQEPFFEFDNDLQELEPSDSESVLLNEEEDSEDQTFLDNDLFPIEDVIDSVFTSLNSQEQLDVNILTDNNERDEEYDFAPSHFSLLEKRNETPIEPEISETNNTVNTIEINEDTKQKTGINDYQFAFYQNIVNDRWLYEKSIDRDRVGFDRYALDEAKISLTDIESLINSGMLYKQIIQHPSGPFVVYSSRLDIEKFIIKETIRRIIRKIRFRFIGRKFEFINWKEFGLAKKVWEFDFEIAKPKIIGSIWISDAYLASNAKTEKNSITQEKKDELKAIIAAATLKMNDEGKAILITNTKENSKIVKKFAKTTGWGVISVLYFADPNFNRKFTKLIDCIS